MSDSNLKEQAMYRIEIDRDLCSGFGSCIDTAPTVFELDSSGVASLLLSESPDQAVLEAAGSCPMGAISIFDRESGKQVS